MGGFTPQTDAYILEGWVFWDGILLELEFAFARTDASLLFHRHFTFLLMKTSDISFLDLKLKTYFYSWLYMILRAVSQ